MIVQYRPIARYLNVLPGKFGKMYCEGCPRPELLDRTFLVVCEDQSIGGPVILGDNNEELKPSTETWPQLEWASLVYLAGDLYFRLTGEDPSRPRNWERKKVN